MPLFFNPVARQPTTLSPLKEKIEDMVHATENLESQLAYIVDDGEAYGLLTEDTFLENCPEVIKNLERICALLLNSVSDLTFDDEVFELGDSGNLAVVLYSFLSEHRRAIDVLATQHKTLKTTGPLFDSISRCLDKERRALERFRAALELRYQDLKDRVAEDWSSFNTSMSAAAQVYPATQIIPTVQVA